MGGRIVLRTGRVARKNGRAVNARCRVTNAENCGILMAEKRPAIPKNGTNAEGTSPLGSDLRRPKRTVPKRTKTEEASLPGGDFAVQSDGSEKVESGRRFPVGR